MLRMSSCPIAVGRVDLTLVLHRRGKRQGFAARARAKIEHLFAWLREGKNRGELRAFVLNFGEALDVGGLGRKRRAAPVRRQRQTQPRRGIRRWSRAQMRETREHLLARRF